MERSVVVGAFLVSASLVLSVMLNFYASRAALPVDAVASCTPAEHASPPSRVRGSDREMTCVPSLAGAGEGQGGGR